MSSNEFTARKVTPLTVTKPADAVDRSVIAECAKLAKDPAVKLELDDAAELDAAAEFDDVDEDLVDVDPSLCLSFTLSNLIGAGFNIVR